MNVKDASDAHKNGQTLVFENARVLPTPEKPCDKVSKIGVGIYKQDREALTYLPGAVYELYTVDDIYSADGTKLLDAGAKLAESSPTNESGFTWFDVDIPIRAKNLSGFRQQRQIPHCGNHRPCGLPAGQHPYGSFIHL